MNENYFSTYDLGIASSLVTLGYELVELDKSNPRKVRFVFKREKDLEKRVNAYWNNELKLPAQRLINSWKLLKTRIYSQDA